MGPHRQFQPVLGNESLETSLHLFDEISPALLRDLDEGMARRRGAGGESVDEPFDGVEFRQPLPGPDLDGPKAGLPGGFPDLPGVGEGEGAPDRSRIDVLVLQRPGQGEVPFVVFDRPPEAGEQPAVGAQYPAALGEPRAPVGKELKALQAEAKIEAIVGERHRQRARHLPVTGEARGGGQTARDLDHAGVDVDAGDLAIGRHPFGGEAGADAGATGDIEDAISRLRRRQIDD